MAKTAREQIIDLLEKQAPFQKTLAAKAGVPDSVMPHNPQQSSTELATALVDYCIEADLIPPLLSNLEAALRQDYPVSVISSMDDGSLEPATNWQSRISESPDAALAERIADALIKSGIGGPDKRGKMIGTIGIELGKARKSDTPG